MFLDRIYERDPARHATPVPTCPRRSRCAPKLRMNCLKEQVVTGITFRASPRPRVSASPLPRRMLCSPMDAEAIDQIVRRALAEDLPDITTDAIFEPEDKAIAALVAKADGFIAG